MTKQFYIYFLLVFSIYGCTKKNKPLFKLLPPEKTGIAFQNDIMEDEYLNILSNEYIYNGAGVGIGDFNNDGLQDVFFAGNQVTNRLYLNEGDLKFKDVTLDAHVAGRGRWATGVSVVDINNDGLRDIYVCVGNHLDPEMCENQLYINTGTDDAGVPIFSEQSAEYGLNDQGYSTHAAFFDFDNDGDLDVYILTNYLDTPTPNKYRPKKTDGSAASTDRLYRNNGDNTFTNVSNEAGIVYEGYGLGVSIVDFNGDGFRDIYVSNDYLTNDLLYINNGDGTFTNKIDKYLKHQTHSAMGHCIADMNNDGLPDIFTLDMLPEDNQGMKKMHGVTRFENEQLNEQFNYQPQYKRNMLQINNGVDAFGNHTFSEIGLMAGIFATEWSWTALPADFDNDGFRDLFITNGYPRDVTDLDYAVSGMSRGRGLSNEESMALIPVRSMSNYIFKNNGDLSFTNKTKEWGLDKPSFANGAASADFDNDGDLDLITSNYNEPAMVYENTLYSRDKERKNHYLNIELDVENSIALGAKVFVYSSDGAIMFEDHSNFGGYRSTVDPTIHFGLGKSTSVDSVLVIWPNMKLQKFGKTQADQKLIINYNPNADFSSRTFYPKPDSTQYLFKDIMKSTGIQYKHEEKIFNDFQLQATLPHMFSQTGPPLAVGDIDGNGMQDLFIGGSNDKAGVIFFQKESGFYRANFEDGRHEKPEDSAVLLFDADNDGDLDVYLAVGSVESGMNLANYQDGFYINNGSGKFEFDPEALPALPVSTSCVESADLDHDGDLDLFVGGGIVPGKYPVKASSYILRNDTENGMIKFTDVTEEFCPDLQEIGMLTDAIFTDFNNDEQTDLIVIGEWMPITFFKNESGKLIDITDQTGIATQTGWWNAVTSGDFDGDGDLDYVVGNEGLNTFFKASAQEPVTAYSSDFDNNGTFDVIITSYILSKDGSRRPYPVHFKSDLAKQLPRLNKTFTTYEAYSAATIEDLLSPQEIENTQISRATQLASCYIENLGEGKFSISRLPTEAQVAPINSLLTEDFDSDGNLDVLAIGNNLGNSVFWGPMDAMNGLLMLGNGRGGFSSLPYTKSGFFVPGDGKDLVKLQMKDGKNIYIASQNQDSLKVFEVKRPGRGN